MFKVYKASAGAGKTTHLVIEYLTLCFRNVDNFRNILAITFTNNSTAEMKARIVAMLYSIAFKNKNDFSSSEKKTFDSIKEANGLSDVQMIETAKDLLHKILYDYDNFSISTIDSFFQRILRSFAYELGLNLNYNVQVQLDDIYTQTIDLLLNRIVAPDKSEENARSKKSLADRVISVLDDQMEESGKWKIEDALRSVLCQIHQEEAYAPMQKLNRIPKPTFDKIIDELKHKRNSLRDEILLLAHKGDNLVSSRSVEEFCYKNKGIYSFFSNVLKNPHTMPNSYVNTYLNEPKYNEQPTAEIHQQLQELVDSLIEKIPEFNQLSAYCYHADKLSIMRDLQEIMGEIKSRDNIFFLSETNAILYSEVKDEDTPYIYEKLGNKYAYFFVDEFQDTSKFQWENLVPLIKNALSQQAPHSSKHDEVGEGIIFGDVKQAIYRFRNGDASLLNNLSTKEGVDEMLYDGRGKLKENVFVVEPLNKNFRSSESVIRFNNAFFDYLHRDSKFTLAPQFYGDVKQELPTSAEKPIKKGFVSICFEDEKTDEKHIENEIFFAIEDARKRGYSYGDIAVLMRGNDGLDAYAQKMVEKGVPVISKESLKLIASPNVKLIINVLQYVASSENSLAKLNIISALVKNGKLKGSLADWLSKEENIFLEKNFKTLLNEADVHFDRHKMAKQPLFSLIMSITFQFGIDKENDVFVTTFLNAVLQQLPSGDMNLIAFLDWWNDNLSKLAIPPTSGVDAVTFNTIHSSKGLEYPVLIFPMRNFSNQKTKKHIWGEYEYTSETGEKEQLPMLLKLSSLSSTKYAGEVDKETNLSDLDNLNALYVAHTRASDCLYIITGTTKATYASALYNFIAKNKNDAIQFQEEEGNPNRWWFGDKNWNVTKTKNNLSTSVLPEWKAQLYHSDFTTDQLIFNSSDTSQEQQMGLYTHDFLASLERFPQNADEIKAVLATVEEEYKSVVENALYKILNDNTLQKYFATDVKCLNEVAIGSPLANGKFALIHRPDRVVFLEDEVMVIDYKTGQPHDSYEKQLQTYCSLLREMGYTNVNYMILYI
ncbi:MAG: UvrD-helicase domain-containing protein [Bacteroidales bacterium]|nr:UvrD-helicase domain-containing protein [Bacteroidales bacterium]